MNPMAKKTDNEKLENEMLERAKNGDVEALQILLSKSEKKILNVLARFDKDQAEDLKQDTMLQAFISFNKFRGDSKFSSWIYKIAQNIAKNQKRKNKRTFNSSNTLNIQEYNNADVEGANPEEFTYCSEIEDKISKEMEKLPKSIRTTFLMHNILGHKYEDIAKKLKCPVGTIKSRMFRARKILKK